MIKRDLEYQCVRQELGQSTRFVFERPLAIVVVGAALVNLKLPHLDICLPSLLTGLLLFNYVFTVSRLWSAARIVGYTQVALEGSLPYKGWETSLHEYRKEWRDRLSCEGCVRRAGLGRSAPRALLYYYPIHYFHVTLVGASLAFGVTVTLNSEPGLTPWLQAAPLLVGSAVFASYAIRNGPRSASRLVEANIVRWKYLLNDPAFDGDKPGAAGGSTIVATISQVWRRIRQQETASSAPTEET